MSRTPTLAANRVSQILADLERKGDLQLVQSEVKTSSDADFMEMLYMSYVAASAKDKTAIKNIQKNIDKQKEFLVKLSSTGGTIKQVDYAKTLGKTRQSLTRLIKNGQLIVVNDVGGGVPVVPVFQLDDSNGALQGQFFGLSTINALMYKKGIVDESRCDFWLTKLPELDDKSPRDYLIKNTNDDSALAKVTAIVENM